MAYASPERPRGPPSGGWAKSSASVSCPSWPVRSAWPAPKGAKVRASLAAKAASLRTHELAEAETADQAATERMSLPIVMLFAGFLFFIGFPAVERVLTGL